MSIAMIMIIKLMVTINIERLIVVVITGLLNLYV